MTVIPAFELSALPQVAQQLIEQCQKYPIWLFEGQMGAGKTTFIKAICAALGVIDDVQSPTFSIVNEYATQSGRTIYHFDCYRLKNETEALDIGMEEYLDSGHLCLIEWPQKIENLLPASCIIVKIDVLSDHRRQIQIIPTK